MKMQSLKNKTFVKTLSSLLVSITIMFAPMSVSALNLQVTHFGSAAGQAACSGIDALDSGQGCGKGNGSSTVSSLIATIVNILSIIVGVIAIIMIIVSGVRFITSGGDAQKVSAAKSGLIYALIGLVLVALAQAIVHFVIGNTTAAIPTPKAGS